MRKYEKTIRTEALQRVNTVENDVDGYVMDGESERGETENDKTKSKRYIDCDLRILFSKYFILYLEVGT